MSSVLPGCACVCVGFLSLCIFSDEMWGDSSTPPQRVCGRVTPRKTGPEYGTILVCDGSPSPYFLWIVCAAFAGVGTGGWLLVPYACVAAGRGGWLLLRNRARRCRHLLLRGSVCGKERASCTCGCCGVRDRISILRNIPGACEEGVSLRVCVRLRSHPREVSGSRDPASQRARANPTATTGYAGSSTPARACQMAVAVGASKLQSLLERYGVEFRAASSGGEACQFIRTLARISDMVSGCRELENEELELAMCFFLWGTRYSRFFYTRRDCAVHAAPASSACVALASCGVRGIRGTAFAVTTRGSTTVVDSFCRPDVVPLFNRDTRSRCSMNGRS